MATCKKKYTSTQRYFQILVKHLRSVINKHNQKLIRYWKTKRFKEIFLKY